MEKSLIVNIDEILQVHPQITVKVHHMIDVCQDGPNLANITSNVEMTDYVLESFMGEPLRMIESDGGSKYEMYQRYRNIIRDLGILSSYGVDDLDELVDNAAVGSIPTALINELENDFQMMQENKMAEKNMLPLR
tara:strand:+ start:3041 stop:3445 length:405 start_codon:yes stop_codon:yes gene_type:complete